MQAKTSVDEDRYKELSLVCDVKRASCGKPETLVHGASTSLQHNTSIGPTPPPAVDWGSMITIPLLCKKFWFLLLFLMILVPRSQSTSLCNICCPNFARSLVTSSISLSSIFAGQESARITDEIPSILTRNKYIDVRCMRSEIIMSCVRNIK